MFKKEIKKISKGIIVGSIIVLGTAGVYATNTDIKTYISNFTSSDSEIGKLITKYFDTEGYIKTNYIKTNSIDGSKLVNDTIGETQIDDNFVAKNSHKLQNKDTETIITTTDNKIPTSKAVVDYVQNNIPAPTDGTYLVNSANYVTKSNGSSFVNSSIYDNGNIGIGTTDPSTKLEVKDGALTIDRHFASPSIYFKHSDGTYYPNISDNWEIYPKGVLSSSSESIFSIGTRRISDGVPSSKFAIRSNGNVGIGTTDPGAPLDVNGYMRITSNSPTFQFNDTDNPNFQIHNNSNRLYFMHDTNDNNSYDDGEDDRIVMYSPGNGVNLGIGTSTPTRKLDVRGQMKILKGGAYDVWIEGLDKNGSSRNLALLGFRTTDRLYLNYNKEYSSGVISGGNLVVTGNVYAPAYIYYSDRRLKKNIYTVKNSLEKINKLRGVTFNWKKGGRKDMGVIAQEVEEILPELVHTDEKGIKSVEYGNFIGVFIEGIKELYNKVMGNTDRIVELEKENEELKNRLDSLEGRMEILESKIGGLNK